MRAAPEKAQVVTAGDAGDDLDLPGQIAMNLGNVAADGGVELDEALEDLGFDERPRAPREVRSESEAPALQRHRLAVDQIELDLDAQ